MKQWIAFVLFQCLLTTVAFGQLNCKEKVTADKGSEKKCLHKNGKVSTLETWDQAKRWGQLKGYNSQGVELFSHSLRSFGGHAYAQIDYYPNGQVSKIYFSDAPDGGIQYYNSTTTFDENGAQTGFYETKYPNELELIKPYVEEVKPQPVKKEPAKEETVKEEPKPEVVECAILFKNYFEVQNATSSKVTLKINALPNNSVVTQSQEVVLEPSQKIVFDTIFTAQIGLKEKVYEVEIVKFNAKRKNKKVKLIAPNPVETTDSKTMYWLVVKE